MEPESCSNHLAADKSQNEGYPQFKVDKHPHYACQQEIESPEPHDGKDVGGKDDERVEGDGKDSRNGINGEQYIAALHHYQRQEQGAGYQQTFFASWQLPLEGSCRLPVLA